MQHDDTTAPAARFYNHLAANYDRMTGLDKRLATATRFVKTLIDTFHLRRPEVGVDLGSGTGAYTLALARIGLRTTGVDLSADMLAQARQNARHHALDPVFLQASLTDLPATLPWGRTDLVLCLGNTLPHLTDPADLEKALLGIRRLLSPTGLAVIQTLNYDDILTKAERIVSIDRDHEHEFIRFYDFLESGLLRFNILEIEWKNNEALPHPIHSVLLRPYRAGELEKAAAAVGLAPRLTAGGLDLHPYDPATADTALLVLGTTSGENQQP